MTPLASRLLAWAAFAAVIVMAAILGIREGVHRERRQEDVTTLRLTRKSVDSLQRILVAARGRVDTVRITVTRAQMTVDTVIQRLDSVHTARLVEAAAARGLRERADSLLARVPAVETAQPTVAVRAAYAYRTEGDTLRAQGERVTGELRRTRGDLLRVNGDLVVAERSLTQLGNDLAGTQSDLSDVRADLRSLQRAREDRCLLGLVVCPGRTVVAVASFVVGAVVVQRVR